ncbi:MAG: hypothetical protein AAFX44_15830 [Pseudomonadota bacterium]
MGTRTSKSNASRQRCVVSVQSGSILLTLFVAALLAPSLAFSQYAGKISIDPADGLPSKNVKAALDWLSKMGADDHRRKIEAHIRAGSLLWDRAIDADGDNGSTDPKGVVTLSAARVGMGTGNIIDFAASSTLDPIIGLALTLVHEMVHVEEHSNDKAVLRNCSNQRRLVFGHVPHEVQAWTITVRHAYDWVGKEIVRLTRTEGWDNRYVGQSEAAAMASMLVKLINNFEGKKFFGDSPEHQSAWLALRADVDTMIAELTKDALIAEEYLARRRCYSQCKSHLLAMLDAHNRERSATARIAELDSQRQSLRDRTNRAKQEIQDAKDGIERTRRQKANAKSETALKALAANEATYRKDLDKWQRIFNELPSEAPIQAAIAAERAKIPTAKADWAAAQQRWRACMAKCLSTELNISYDMSQLPPGFSEQNGQIVYTPGAQPNLREMTFHAALWHEKLESHRAKLPVAFTTDRDECEPAELTGITVAVADVFGPGGLQVLPAPGVTIIVRDANGREIAREKTGKAIAADFIALAPGDYTLRLEIGKFEPALPPQCTDGYTREINVAKGQHRRYTASVYSVRVATDGQSVGTVTGDCIREQQ